MRSVVDSVVAGAGVLAEEFDPTVQPSRGSFYVFVFLLLATVLLSLSFLRHLRRAQTNLGSGKEPPAVVPAPPAEDREGDRG
jgi:hypothetical protein